MAIPAASTSRRAQSNLGAMLPLVLLPLAIVALRNRMPAWAFMWLLAFLIFAGLKLETWFRARGLLPHNLARSLAYLLAWPGMDAVSFLDSQVTAPRPRAGEWLWAFSKTALGISLLWIIARLISPVQTLLRGWIGLFGLIFLLHFGTFHLLSLFWRAQGIKADPIMDAPIKSRSLSEFWGKRWNLGFRQLAHELIFQPLYRKVGAPAAGFFVFLVSGLVHDLVISFPARGGYGLPTTYFVIQGIGVALERSTTGVRLGLQAGTRGWLFTLVVTAGPAFWLFHPPFVLRVILPFMHAVHAI